MDSRFFQDISIQGTYTSSAQGEQTIPARVAFLDPEGLARRRAVEVGLRARDRVEVVAGLEPGDRVVTAGASLLSEGIPVRVVGG